MEKNIDNPPKTLLEQKYQMAFKSYNQKEKAFFDSFNTGRGDWAPAQKEMVEAWKSVDDAIQEMIALKNKVRYVKSRIAKK